MLSLISSSPFIEEDVDLNEIAKLLQARTELFTEIPEW